MQKLGLYSLPIFLNENLLRNKEKKNTKKMINFITMYIRNNVSKMVKKNIPMALQSSSGFLPVLSTRFIESNVNPRSIVVAPIVTSDACMTLRPADRNILVE